MLLKWNYKNDSVTLTEVMQVTQRHSIYQTMTSNGDLFSKRILIILL